MKLVETTFAVAAIICLLLNKKMVAAKKKKRRAAAAESREQQKSAAPVRHAIGQALLEDPSNSGHPLLDPMHIQKLLRIAVDEHEAGRDAELSIRAFLEVAGK